MQITSYFSQNGLPKLGLTPVITIRETLTGTLVSDQVAMTEIGDGFYTYNFTGYDQDTDYVFLTDGGPGLVAYERYQSGATGIEGRMQDIQGKVGTLRDITAGRWKITNNQMILYGPDNSTELMRFDLFDHSGAPTMSSIFERRRV